MDMVPAHKVYFEIEQIVNQSDGNESIDVNRLVN